MISIALEFLKVLPWRKILPILAVVAVLVSIWWRVDSHFDHVADLEVTKIEQAGVIKDLKRTIANMTAAQAEANAATEAAERARDVMDQAYQDLVAKPPAEIVRWRERIVTIPAEITGPTCEDALIQAHRVIVETSGWPE
ncbi:MAG: hypothetical protein DRJ65_00170 [Acidobacteria bacterium]|nr:MAG: hypothetical protein DRJ65_00170 [Acidobacteriota bacterium]